MVFAYRRDERKIRLGNIRAVVQTAQTDFQQYDITRMCPKIGKHHGCHYFEFRQWTHIRAADFLIECVKDVRLLQYVFIRDIRPIHADPFIETDDMRRGEGAHRIAGRHEQAS